MNEKTKSNGNCDYCGRKFPPEFLSKIKDKSSSFLCENCGTEIFIESNDNDETVKDVKDNCKKRGLLSRIYEAVREEKNPIARVLIDSDFTKRFKDNLKIVISRLLYPHIQTLESESTQDKESTEITQEILDDLYDKISPIMNQRIKDIFLNNLNELSDTEFNKWLKLLQDKIKLNNSFRKDFINYLYWMIREVYIIITELWDVKDLPKFERIIRDDLKLFVFNLDSLPIKITQVISNRKIIFDNDYYKNFKSCIEIITYHLSIKKDEKKNFYKKALELYDSALKNGLRPSDLEVKGSGVLSIVFIYFSLLFYDYTKIKNDVLTYGTICRSLGKEIQKIGISSCRSRNLGVVSKFLPTNLRRKYKQFYSRRLYTGRLSFEEFINFIKELGLRKTGIEGKALSLNLNYKNLIINDYKELTSEEYYTLIENKKGTAIRFPIWCGKDDHTPWNGILSNLLQGKWCRNCSNEKKITFSLERLKEIARIRGYDETGVEGKILDSKNGSKELTLETYIRLTANKTPSKTQFWWNCCIKGHPPWRTTPGHIFFDHSWCPICKRGLYTHIELIKLAKIRGCEETGVEGKILDSKNGSKELTLETYNRLTTNKKASGVSFWWSCERNHFPFKNNPANIRRGQWCTFCSSDEGKFEKRIREHFKTIIGVDFPPVFLRDLNLKYMKMDIDMDLSKENGKTKFEGYKVNFNNPGQFKIYSGKMRFDGYAKIKINKKLIQIAFEYNGKQHYEFPNYWFENSVKGYKSWLEYIERDQIKKEISKLNNVYLIEVPFYIDIALEHPKKIQSYIINQFELITGIKL